MCARERENEKESESKSESESERERVRREVMRKLSKTLRGKFISKPGDRIVKRSVWVRVTLWSDLPNRV